MKHLLSLLLAPALALAGTFSGTVVSLDGTPIVGATIKLGTDSVTTTPNGAWSLARSAGIAPPSVRTVPVTSHLTLENGRPRLSFGGLDIAGRSAHKPATGQIPSNLAAARSQAASDTLRVYWKGKRLTVLPVPADTGSLVFKIDTAWKDDAGIPWNPSISYGSLLDSRDGQTYRTVSLDSQTWMAENLNYAAADSWWFKGIDSTEPDAQGIFGYLDDSATVGGKYGRYYTWSASMALPDSCDSLTCSTAKQSACPAGWHIPSIGTEWHQFYSYAYKDSSGDSINGVALKAQSGWGYLKKKTDSLGYGSPNGRDLVGFRVLNAGARIGPSLFSQKIAWGWWANTDLGIYNTASAWYLGWTDPWRLGAWEGTKHRGLPVRCLKDTP
jgi:uncharacterized protein (TIGR02145 family)